MIYDARANGKREAGASRFPCPVMIVDAVNGERIPNVFWADTAGKLKRFLTDPYGSAVAGADHQRLDIFEVRPWKAVSLDGREVIAESAKCYGDWILNAVETGHFKYERWNGSSWDECTRESCHLTGAIWRQVGGVRCHQTLSPQEHNGEFYFTCEHCDSPEGMSKSDQDALNQTRLRAYSAAGHQGVFVL